MSMKWLQVRVNGSKYGSRIGFEGPGVAMALGFGLGGEREARERLETGYEPLALHAAPYTGLYSWA